MADGLGPRTDFGPEAFVYKVAAGRLQSIPCRVDPGDLLVRPSGLYVIENCAPEDVVCLASSLTWHLQTQRNELGRLLGEKFEA